MFKVKVEVGYTAHSNFNCIFRAKRLKLKFSFCNTFVFLYSFKKHHLCAHIAGLREKSVIVMPRYKTNPASIGKIQCASWSLTTDDLQNVTALGEKNTGGLKRHVKVIEAAPLQCATQVAAWLALVNKILFKI